MVDGIHTWLERETASASQARAVRAAPPDPRHLREIIGAVDRRVPFTALAFDATTARPAEVGTGHGYRIYAVRWPVFEGVDGEGLLLDSRHSAGGARRGPAGRGPVAGDAGSVIRRTPGRERLPGC